MYEPVWFECSNTLFLIDHCWPTRLKANYDECSMIDEDASGRGADDQLGENRVYGNYGPSSGIE